MTEKIYLSNLGGHAKADWAKDHFSQYGKGTRVNVPLNSHGFPQGFGFVVFEKAEEATAAAVTENFDFRGYSIHVRTIDEDAPEDKAVSDVEKSGGAAKGGQVIFWL